VTSIGPTPPLGPVAPELRTAIPSDGGSTQGFGDMLASGLESVSASENQADDLAQRLAIGDPTVELHDVTIAAAEAGLSVQLMVAVRDRALEAYQQIMNLQI
jgi:flagellar hook-basal body complex protein FliE